MKLLHLDSSIQREASASRALSAAVVERLRSDDAGLDVTYRDLAGEPLAHLTLDAFAGAEAQATLTEFLASDIVVIGAGLYNFTIPSQLKAWIDRILVAGQTFRYGETGPEGLVKGKRVIVALARGGLYGEGSPFASYEHAETLLRGTFGFIGVEPEFIVAEGLNYGADRRKAAIEAAMTKIGQVHLQQRAA
ncbi:FMN-dependent NADH-azoreductase [Aureimonas sp. AU20]|uniref:FMN-dependent NADH-azoreductase n=1 Tax=Aureimonas sp. AU20 TaxID=1349819 RepID=UPI0007214884|nr:NAD(P)H-dependent oxidoreductase [Aureimonas sp. AU20]ALN71856.1 hypothetical protein M673_03960 [Aureimonas sp. AU20]